MRRLLTLAAALAVFSLLLCSCGTVNGYKKKDLVPVNETLGSGSIQVFVVDQNEEKGVMVKIKNLTDDVFYYGEYYSIQIFIEGVWYYVPTEEEFIVHDLAHELQPRMSYVETYSLAPYGGKLNPGHYRIACCDLGDNQNIHYAEFNVMANGRYQFEIIEPTVA